METSARILVNGTYNFRDVGGFTAANGVVRHGVLFRSDGLGRLGEAGRQQLRELNIGHVIDLRDDYEVRSMPDDLDGLDVRVEMLPVFEGSGASANANTTLPELYERIITQHSHVVVTALREIATTGDRATIVHCTAGKDRTGVIVALALLAVGVDREDVLVDYEVTEANLNGEWLTGMLELLARFGVADSPSLRVLLSGSPRDALEVTLSLVETSHGSVVEYLLTSGLTRDELTQLERVLVATD